MTLGAVRVPSDDPGGWGRWNVVDDAGHVVGLVAEYREWLGAGHGPITFDVAHRTAPMPAAACWCSRGHRTIPDAVAALSQHLAAEQLRVA